MNTHLGPPARDFHAPEFVLVIALAFGLNIAASLELALSYTGSPMELSDAELLAGLAFELFLIPVIWLVLRSRGWTLADFAVHRSKGSTVLGGLLAIAILAVWYLFEVVFGKVPVVSKATLLPALALSIVNPFFEEFLVLAYVIQAMRKRFGLVTAMNVSIAIRLLYHLYQGPLAVIPIAFFGVVMTLVYVRMGRLWPAIVAHGILDFVALSGWID